jgi:AcrR family transcriptional regulator
MPPPAGDETTKARLLVAAGELLIECGFAAITTRAISERAGVNNALVHYHFGTKAQLLAEAALGLLGEDMDHPMRMLRDAPSVTDGIRDVLVWIADLDITEPAVRVLIELTVEAFNNEHVRPVVAAALDTGRVEMAAALASRADVDDSAAAPLAALLAALFDGVILHRMVDADLDVTGWADGAASLAPWARSRRSAR